MPKLVAILCVAAAIIYWQNRDTHPVGKLPSPHGEVIMYGLTTCGHCQIMADKLKSEGIVFTERMIDTDSVVKDEVHAKLTSAGFEGRTFGTPILDVNGTMLPDNPPFKKVKKYL